MIKIKDALTSSLGKKILNALTAIGAVLFVIVHLAGNLTIYGGAEALNGYAAKLHALGPLLPVLEIGLLAVFVIHIVTAIMLTVENSGARSEDYVASRSSKKGPSKWSFASVRMIISGLVLLVFLGIHVAQFRLAPYWKEGVGADYYKHLYTDVWTAFQDPVWVGAYTIAMVFLGFHLRHGIWSMLQSVGAMNSRWSKTIYAAAFVIAVLLAVGFLMLPVSVFMGWTPAPPTP